MPTNLCWRFVTRPDAGKAATALADVDLHGPWAVTLSGPGLEGLRCVLDVTQSGASIAVSGTCPSLGAISAGGTIDPGSGAFAATGSADALVCPTLALSGAGSQASDAIDGTFDCRNGLAGAFVAGLCGNGVLDAGEACEPATACCSATCAWASAGAPCGSEGNASKEFLSRYPSGHPSGHSCGPIFLVS